VFKFITHQPFWVNFLIALVLVVLSIFIFFNSLDWITKHGDTKKVPSVTGKNIAEATQILDAQGFDVQVQDSVYIDTVAKSAVIKQAPEADALVKQNRTIYLTINRAVAPLVDMPDLRGFSFLSAKLYLQSLGLKLGDTSYRPDIARNSVLEQSYNNKPVEPATKVSMGSLINLVLGDGVGNATMDVPDLIGMSFGEAKDYLSSMNLGLGAVIPNGDVQDRANAFIYKQNPDRYNLSPSGGNAKNKIRPGEVLDLWLSVQAPLKDTISTLGQPPADQTPN
jgi:beta-lactam-binding protein with PASTA domain